MIGKSSLAIWEHLSGFGPIEGDFNRTQTVVGEKRASQTKGKSLILQGHLDVVPTGPNEMWEYPTFDFVIKNGWMYGRGTLCAKCY